MIDDVKAGCIKDLCVSMLSGCYCCPSHRGGSSLWSCQKTEHPPSWTSLESHPCALAPSSTATRHTSKNKTQLAAKLYNTIHSWTYSDSQIYIKSKDHIYLLISATKVSLVPLENLTESYFSFPRIHHTSIIVLQEGFSSSAKLVVNVLFWKSTF